MATDKQLSTYIGNEAQFDGVTYRWDTDRYIPVNPLRRGFADGFGQTRKVIVPFVPKYQSRLKKLDPLQVNVYVDGVLWDNESVEKGPNSINITFDEKYILQQRVITFSTERVKSFYQYTIRARVNDENDVVIVESLITDEQPILGPVQVPTTEGSETTGVANLVTTPTVVRSEEPLTRTDVINSRENNVITQPDIMSEPTTETVAPRIRLQNML